MDAPLSDLATASAEESLSALSTQLLSHGYLTRPLDLSTLFLAPSLPSSSSSKALKKHHDTLILQARARDQLAKCLWGMLEKRGEEREVLEGMLAREARAQGEGERERTMRERAEREAEGVRRELEAERARAREAETKLKIEQERHRHAKDELAKMRSALQFVKTQSLYDQKRREAKVTALHARLQKLTTSSESSFTRFVVLNPSASSTTSSSSPFSATFGGRTSHLSSGHNRSSTPSSSSPATTAQISALTAELDLVQAELDECTSVRTHLEGENRALREFVGDVGEWAEGVCEMEEFGKMREAEEGGEEVREVLDGGEGDESYLIPTPHLSLPVPTLVTPLHRKLYGIRLALSTLSSSSASRLSSARAELNAEIDELREQLEHADKAREEAEKELGEMEERVQGADRLVREFAERQGEGRRETMTRGGESDDDSLPAELASQLAAQKVSKRGAISASSSRPVPPPSAAAPPAATAGPRPSEPPSAGVAAFLSELGLDTPAAPAEALVSAKVRAQAQQKKKDEGEVGGKEYEKRFEKLPGSVEKAREKKGLGGVAGVEGARVRASVARVPSGTENVGEETRTSGSSASSAPSSALSSILSLSDSPPVPPSYTRTSVPAAAASKEGKEKTTTTKPPASSSLQNGASRTSGGPGSEADKVRAKKMALLERARAASGGRA
ncbi:hypothetical protein JCM8547_000549 [Rhodosporidiobolus lusitaniae]